MPSPLCIVKNWGRAIPCVSFLIKVGARQYQSNRMSQFQQVWTMTYGLVQHPNGRSTGTVSILHFAGFGDYAGGLMTDWSVHLLDYALFGMNVMTLESIMDSGG